MFFLSLKCPDSNEQDKLSLLKVLGEHLKNGIFGVRDAVFLNFNSYLCALPYRQPFTTHTNLS